jgi:hypothetical protein
MARRRRCRGVARPAHRPRAVRRAGRGEPTTNSRRSARTTCRSTLASTSLRSSSSKPRSRSKRPASRSPMATPRKMSRPCARRASESGPRSRSSRTSSIASPAPQSARSGQESASTSSRPRGRGTCSVRRRTPLAIRRRTCGARCRKPSASGVSTSRTGPRFSSSSNRIEPGAGQVNGPPSSCAWERELADLERGLKRGDDLEPPLPRWHGKVWRRQEDEAARRLRSERREGATA